MRARARVWVLALVAGAWGTTGTTGAQSASSAPFDLAAAENGGRIEWVTGQVLPVGAASNLVSGTTRYPDWYSDKNEPGRREELVFSFFSHQSALVGAVQINSATPETWDRPKDVEIWTSMQSPTEGFVKAGGGTLTDQGGLQSIDFAPVEAKYVSVRIVNAYPGMPGTEPGGYAIAASRLRILEGARAGYTPLLARSPELASVLKGAMPGAPPPATLSAAATPPAATCEAPSVEGSAKRPSTYTQSRNVLLVANTPTAFQTFGWKTAANDPVDLTERPAVKGVTFSWVTPTGFAPAQLVADPKIDTVLFAQVCGINDDLRPAYKQALLAWVSAGHKAIFEDSDACTGADKPVYSLMPFPFETENPRAAGKPGTATILENSSLVSTNPRDAAYIDTDGWAAGNNDLGDANVVVKYDAHWCGAAWAKTWQGHNGFALAYTHYGRGLIIYNGFDKDDGGIQAYLRLETRLLLHPFDPDYLSCSQHLGDFIIAATPEQKSQLMAPGHTYSYPLSILGNFGYTGKVTLEAAVTPADPAIGVKLDRTTIDLTKTDEASATLTVTTSPNASLASKVVAVQGKDAAGRSNVLCLELPERRTGGLTITSGLEDKPRKTLEIILDASGSMKLPLGRKTRWATAQEVLADVVAKLPADYQVGLRTYGHREASTSPQSCTDTELVVPVGPLDRERLLQAARQLKPRGETPLVYSALQTPGDLAGSAAATVVLITDGEESCKGDFAAAAKSMKESGLDVRLSIVGFTLTNVKAQADLKGLAQSTGGRYYSAQNGAQLSRALLLAAVDQVPYRVLDAKGTEVTQGVAGLDGKHELAPGDYTVVLTAGDELLKVPVSLALRQDVSLRVVIKDDKLAVEK